MNLPMVKGNNNDFRSIKTIILVALCLQNAGYTLLRKLSTKTENVSSKEILIIAEFLKIFIAIWFTLTEKEKSDSEGEGINKLLWLIVNSQKMFVLAGIYAAMNILSFVALQYIGAGEFTVCAQLKILSTASFSVLVLGTKLTWTKWRALFMLVLGCILVASPNFNSTTDQTREISAQLLGYGAVLLEVLLSGFASIYFEKVVKSTSEVITIWERNFQLGVYSILMYGGIILYEGNQSNTQSWSNWSFLTFVVALLGAGGGLLVAATLKYADSILKTLAAAGAIILSVSISLYFTNPFIYSILMIHIYLIDNFRIRVS